MAAPKTVALVMAGGSGTRFWPLSRKSRPKQYISFHGDKSLIQQTVERLAPLVEPDQVFVCAHKSHEDLLKDQLPQVCDWFLEPEGKNTTACLMYSLAELEKRGFDRSTRMITLPADHFIQDDSRFRTLLTQAIECAASGEFLVTLGIVPNQPHIGYGYIEAGEKKSHSVFAVKRFVEKPNLETATQFLLSQNFFWNSGIFVWTLGALGDAFERFVGAEWSRIKRAVQENQLESAYAQTPSVPVDIAVMEKAKNVLVIPAENIGWTDLGSWNALYEMRSLGTGSNVVLSGTTKSVESEGCLVRTASIKKVALIGVKDLIIVEDGDTLLIAHRESDQMVREASKEFDP